MSTLGRPDLLFALPLLILALGVLAILVLESSLKFEWHRATWAVWFVTLAIGFSIITLYYSRPDLTLFHGLLYADRLACFMTVLLLSAACLTLMVGSGQLSQQGLDAQGEYYALILLVTMGAIIFCTAAELLTLFVGLELMSLALYSLCGAAVKERRSSEAALKYFVLGSFCSAILLYGVALIYGLTGSTTLSAVREALAQVDSPLALFAIGLVLVGLVFKIGAVPFHFWIADVYEGAPTSVSAFMACAIKIAAFGAALRVIWQAFGASVVFWSGAVWLMAALTMTLGNLVALRQRSLKRMLAYSSIAHAGYMMVAFLARGEQFGGGAAVLYYLAAYTLMTMGAFSVVLAVTSGYTQSPHPDDITRLNGLGHSKPFLGFVMALFMLSLAGLPPGMAGLLGKFYIFNAAVRSGYIWLALIGVLNSAISCYYYLRVVVAMFFIEPPIELSDQRPPALEPALAAALTFCALGVLLLGIFPSYLYQGAISVLAGY